MTRKFVITPDGEGFVDFTPEEEAQAVKDRETEVARREAEAAAEAQKLLIKLVQFQSSKFLDLQVLK